MKRTGFRPCTEGMATTAKLSVPVFRPRTCAKAKGGCGERFTPARQMQSACSPACAHRFADKAKAKREATAAADDGRLTRAKLEAMKSLGTLREEANKEFRLFCRLRDKAAGITGCICCGEPLDWNSTKHGGAVDGGHWLSRGAYPELAFDERNCSAQRKGCNRPGGAKAVAFRAGMVARWGEAAVLDLERPHPMTHWRHDDYRRIRAHYRAECRRINRENP